MLLGNTLRRLGLGCVVIALAGSLAGCAPDDGASGSRAGTASGSSPEPSPSATSTTPAEPPLASTTVELDPVALTITAAQEPGVRGDAGTATIVVEVTPDVPVVFAVDSGGSFTVHSDRSVTVHDDGGAPVAGLTAPTDGARFFPPDPDADGLSADSSTLELRATGSGSKPVVASTTLGTSGVAATSWGDREGGLSLAVTPTDWARTAGRAGEDLVWAELVAAEPEADSATMRDQLTCHVFGAPDKDTWNLEPWRPDVGLFAVLAAQCNPTED